jgi:hypothetical protein
MRAASCWWEIEMDALAMRDACRSGWPAACPMQVTASGEYRISVEKDSMIISWRGLTPAWIDKPDLQLIYSLKVCEEVGYVWFVACLIILASDEVTYSCGSIIHWIFLMAGGDGGSRRCGHLDGAAHHNGRGAAAGGGKRNSPILAWFGLLRAARRAARVAAVRWKMGATPLEVISFSYWSIKPRFLTEEKLTTVLIIPFSWGFPTVFSPLIKYAWNLHYTKHMLYEYETSQTW